MSLFSSPASRGASAPLATAGNNVPLPLDVINSIDEDVKAHEAQTRHGRFLAFLTSCIVRNGTIHTITINFDMWERNCEKVCRITVSFNTSTHERRIEIEQGGQDAPYETHIITQVIAVMPEKYKPNGVANAACRILLQLLARPHVRFKGWRGMPYDASYRRAWPYGPPDLIVPNAAQVNMSFQTVGILSQPNSKPSRRIPYHKRLPTREVMPKHKPSRPQFRHTFFDGFREYYRYVISRVDLSFQSPEAPAHVYVENVIEVAAQIGNEEFEQLMHNAGGNDLPPHVTDKNAFGEPSSENMMELGLPDACEDDVLLAKLASALEFTDKIVSDALFWKNFSTALLVHILILLMKAQNNVNETELCRKLGRTDSAVCVILIALKNKISSDVVRALPQRFMPGELYKYISKAAVAIMEQLCSLNSHKTM